MPHGDLVISLAISDLASALLYAGDCAAAVHFCNGSVTAIPAAVCCGELCCTALQHRQKSLCIGVLLRAGNRFRSGCPCVVVKRGISFSVIQLVRYEQEPDGKHHHRQTE